MRLRFATEDDAAVLADVHGKAFDSAWTAPDIARLMTILGGFALVAEDEGIVGFVLARSVGGEAEILTLAVAPWARRRGVGAALVEAVAVHAGAGGSKALFLEVAADNQAAVGVYLKTGFKQAGLRRAYYSRPGAAAVDALVLRRALNSRPS